MKQGTVANLPETSHPERISEGSRSLRRAIGILDIIHTSGRAMSVAEIVATLGIPKSTAYELVRVMLSEGLLNASDGSKLALGRRLYELGMGYSLQEDLVREGTRIVRELRDETGETVQLSVLDGDLMLVLVKEEGIRAVRIISKAGSRVPVNWAAAGRLLVSDHDDAALRRLLQATVAPSPTGLAETDVTRLIRQIREFRQRGYAVEMGETNEHAGCVAAPVLDADGKCVAAISVVAPEHRLAPPHFQELAAAVTRKAADLSRVLFPGAPV